MRRARSPCARRCPPKSPSIWRITLRLRAHSAPRAKRTPRRGPAAYIDSRPPRGQMKGSMRAVVALVLSAVLFALSWAPHVHHHDVRGDHECPACIARNSDAAHYEVPDLEPVAVVFARVPDGGAERTGLDRGAARLHPGTVSSSELVGRSYLARERSRRARKASRSLPFPTRSWRENAPEEVSCTEVI